MSAEHISKKEQVLKIFNELGEANLRTIYQHYQKQYTIPTKDLVTTHL